MSKSKYIEYIEDQYRMEIEYEHRDSMQKTVSFNFPAEDACMLAAIAKRFGKSTAAFGGELYASTVRELFIGLGPEDREALAVEADAEVTRYADSKGISITSNDGEGANHWRTYARICNAVDSGELKAHE